MIKLLRKQTIIALGLALTLSAAACGEDSSGNEDARAGGGGEGAGTSNGTSAGGGSPTGGSPTGGSPTGGSPTGGSPTGGNPTGGNPTGGGDPADARVFDHRHTALEEVPASCIEALKSASWVFHYAHRSHGSQIIVGAESLEASNQTYGFEAEYCSAPNETGVFRMWDGMTSNNLVPANDYWATEAGISTLRTILSQNPEIRYTMWAWSFEISSQTQEQVQQYLTTMSTLEQEFPEVTFIYMTGPGDEEYNAVNRVQRNQQIRDFCAENGKILYDFEDLDSHYNGERHTAVVEGVEVPMEHPRYDVDTQGNSEYQYTHTTEESCVNKARAFWRMMAELEGCAVP